ncbi:helix-turn-helix domain-containing protein [Sphingobium sp.]|uniref:helix-turn-helix domain-containing protein n=1 Tax=Sphingobium sp. TaxID=1912891 RepID=UPI0025E83DC9|nr:helix-turn-helix domain-containing protein [Sphingobium sp.]
MSRRPGRPGNRRLDDAIRDQIVALVRTHYHDFGPTLAAEYLAERHDLRISREKLRKLMMTPVFGRIVKPVVLARISLAIAGIAVAS